MQNAMNKKRNDLILLLGIVLIAALVLIAFHFLKADGATIEVTKNGKKIAEYPLTQNAEIKLDGAAGHAILIIEDGQAYIKEASCPDKLCIKQGKINKNGETVICLPNKLVVTVNSEDDSAAIS
jgi:hypothetical protein